jgi:fucose 4-O-acetylase-like acetyltransferase
LFSVIGSAIYYFRIPNPWNIQQALLLLPFVCMGQNLRVCPLKKQHENVMLAIFLAITMCDMIFNIPLGGIMGKISLNLYWFPLLLLQSFCGTIFIIKLAKIIEKSCVLENIGKASLSVYIFHMYFLTKTLPIMRNFTMNFLLGVAYISFILLVCVIVDKILNTKYFKFILGKF